MAYIQVKFCGMREPKQALVATTLGADAIGLVFYPPSPRAITAEQAQAVVAKVPAFTSVVALTVNIPAADLQRLTQHVRFDVIQFHGDETAKQCQKMAALTHKRWIKALRVNADQHSQHLISQYIADYAKAGASGVLLDAYHPDTYGGTGTRFDWALIPETSPVPLILAGGLTPDNVGEALRAIQERQLPVVALDVSGGIERSKGNKDNAKMHAFIQARTNALSL